MRQLFRDPATVMGRVNGIGGRPANSPAGINDGPETAALSRALDAIRKTPRKTSLVPA
jgi:hypothetical protein